MEISRPGKRDLVFHFPEMEINLLAIYGERRTYLCDTFLGPEPMELVKQALLADGRRQPIVIFNSHHHWDHVWGNCAFPDALIVAHELTLDHLERDFDRELREYAEWARGMVTPGFPDLTFSDRLVFADDGVEFFHSPGHTGDSASCLDRREGVLFVGDSVEEPIPYVQDQDLERYAATLEGYLKLLMPAGGTATSGAVARGAATASNRPAYQATVYVAGHGRTFSRDLIESNLVYVRSLAAGKEADTTDWSDGARQVHEQNLRTLRGQ